ncbi:MAG: hypothetical protein NXH85_16240 [Pseudomonadaceae bacterium]|nr:hypothetical protein [Pseudomonadaceae bacterium]
MPRRHRADPMRIAAALLLAVALAGCTATPSPGAMSESTEQPLPALDTVVFSVGYYLDLDAAERADLGPAPTVALALPLLSGTFIGAPADVGLNVHVDDYDRVGVDFNGVSSLIERSISRQPVDGELQIEPSDTRFGRFGTFAFEPRSGASLGRTGFLDEAASEYLWLTYFDRPCQVRGRQPLPDGTHLDYHVDIPRAGLYWLRLAPSAAGGGDDIYRVGSAIAPVLGIELPKPKTVTL